MRESLLFDQEIVIIEKISFTKLNFDPTLPTHALLAWQQLHESQLLHRKIHLDRDLPCPTAGET